MSKNKLVVGVLVSAVASVALPVGAIGGAGSASATCVSIFGIGIGNGCTSTLTSLAIGLGPNTTADAGGILGGAIAIGLANGEGETTSASTEGNFSFAYAGGSTTSARALGNLSVAFVQGSQADAAAGLVANDFGNVAINFGNGLLPGTNTVRAAGTLNLAANLGGNGTGNNPSDVQAFGILNNAINLGGSQNAVSAGNASGGRATFSSASNFFGINNVVTAGPGPAAVASAFGSTGPVTQAGPGININNFGVGGEAATSGQSSIVPAGNRAKTPLNPGRSASVTAAGGSRGSLFRPSLDFSPTGSNAASNSGNTRSLGGSTLKSVSDRITKSAKRFSDTVSKVTGGLAAGAKTETASTSNE